MIVKLAILTDAATASPDGKLNMLGAGISIIGRESLPAAFGATLVVQFEYTSGESGRSRTLEVQINDEDGRPVAQGFQQTLTLPERGAHVPKNLPLNMGFVIDLHQLPLQAYGTHVIEVLLDGNNVASVPFVVVAPTQLSAAA
jgi:hypothetical protein